jgi:hypothetical protein
MPKPPALPGRQKKFTATPRTIEQNEAKAA